MIFNYQGEIIKYIFMWLSDSLSKRHTRESWCNASMSPEMLTAVMHNTNIIAVE